MLMLPTCLYDTSASTDFLYSTPVGDGMCMLVLPAWLIISIAWILIEAKADNI